MLEKIGKQTAFNRDLFVLDIPSPTAFPDKLEVSSPRFACLLAWDASGVPVEAIRSFARRLLDGGAVWISCWGPDCERVHDAIDEEFRWWPDRGPDGVVMTTWHPDESLREVIADSLLAFAPDDHYLAGCNSVVAVAVGEPAWAGEMRAAYVDCGAYLARVLQAEGSDEAV